MPRMKNQPRVNRPEMVVEEGGKRKKTAVKQPRINTSGERVEFVKLASRMDDREGGKKYMARELAQSRKELQRMKRSIAALTGADGDDSDDDVVHVSAKASKKDKAHARAALEAALEAQSSSDEDAPAPAARSESEADVSSAEEDEAPARALGARTAATKRPKKKVLGRSQRMRHTDHMRLSRMLNKVRFGSGTHSGAVDARIYLPIKDATSVGAVRYGAHAANDNAPLCVGHKVCVDISHDASDQLLEALVRVRDTGLAQKCSSRSVVPVEYSDSQMQAFAFASTVRAAALECAVKQSWANKDPPGFDSCGLFDAIMAQVAADPAEARRVARTAELTTASDKRRADKAFLADLQTGDASKLSPGEQGHLKRLLAARDAATAEKGVAARAALVRAIANNTRVADNLRDSGIPTTTARIAELESKSIVQLEADLKAKQVIVAELGAVVAQKREEQKQAAAAADAKSVDALRNDVRVKRRERTRARKDTQRLNARLQALRAYAHTLKESLPKKEQRILDAHARIVAAREKLGGVAEMEE